jgi:methionyl-tRNA formyltransferase
MFDEKEVKIYDCALVDGDGVVGEVVEVIDEGVCVQADGGRILIKRVRVDQAKVPASEWAAAVGVGVGMKLG